MKQNAVLNIPYSSEQEIRSRVVSEEYVNAPEQGADFEKFSGNSSTKLTSPHKFDRRSDSQLVYSL